MVRWRCSLLLALLLLLPRIEGKLDDDEEEESTDDDGEDGDSDSDSDDDDEDEKDTDSRRRQGPGLIVTPKSVLATRTTAKRPLECYVCAFRIDKQLKSCLNPSKNRVHTMTCQSAEDKCFMTLIVKDRVLEGMMRGCRSSCVASPDTTCCETNRCNSHVFTMPTISPRAVAGNKTTKSMPTTVLFFVTILLVLQTVVKVAFV